MPTGPMWRSSSPPGSVSGDGHSTYHERTPPILLAQIIGIYIRFANPFNRVLSK